MLSALGAALTRSREQAAVRWGTEASVADDKDEAQQRRPRDGVRPAETRLDLWAQLPEGRRGQGWVEPDVLADYDDPTQLSVFAVNWMDPPARVRAFFLSFVRAYSVLVADYYGECMDLQDAVAKERIGMGTDDGAVIEDDALPPLRLAAIAGRYGWQERWGRVLRATALRVMQARLAGKEPSSKDVRRLRRAKSGPSATKME